MITEDQWFRAAERGDLPTLRQNFHYFEGNRNNYLKNTALITATLHNQPDCVAFLARFECGLTNSQQRTALIEAVCYKHPECVPFLLSEQSAKDKFGGCALYWACYCNYYECAQYLLGEVGVVNNEGKTPLQIASEYGRDEIVQLIENYQKDKMFRVCDENDWFIAVKAGYLESIKKYYQQYKSERTDKGESSLQLAGYYNHSDCVEYLAQFELKLVDQEGRTALMRAASRNSAECVPFLLQEIDIVDKEGNDALFYATENECFESANILLKQTYSELQDCVKILDEQIRDIIDLRKKEEDEIMRIVVVIGGEL